MEITLDNVGRRFNQEWIFRNLSYSFDSSGNYAVLGPNGSGKSTLLSVLLGSLSLSEGNISYKEEVDLRSEAVYSKMSLAAPYLDLIEEFTLQETIDFHFQFKKPHPRVDKNAILELLGLGKAQDKALKYFSSGMKQRTKLVLACCADTPVLILDEPTSNLDNQGVNWYHDLIERFTADRLVIIGSNQQHEYSFCHDYIQITDYK
ncbi:MAG: ATP-binding cassette domain-containing protein [Pedobacter sp.]|nr:MAG: ATP-binding cassette domain-containing protein [Pedobacter sp.]